MIRFFAMLAVASLVFLAGDIQQANGQYVTTYYAPAPAPYVPVRTGYFGFRTAYVPVAPVTSYYAPAVAIAPAPVVAYSPVVRRCHSYYAPTVTLRPIRPVVRTWYSPW